MKRLKHWLKFVDLKQHPYHQRKQNSCVPVCVLSLSLVYFFMIYIHFTVYFALMWRCLTFLSYFIRHHEERFESKCPFHQNYGNFLKSHLELIAVFRSYHSLNLLRNVRIERNLCDFGLSQIESCPTNLKNHEFFRNIIRFVREVHIL